MRKPRFQHARSPISSLDPARLRPVAADHMPSAPPAPYGVIPVAGEREQFCYENVTVLVTFFVDSTKMRCFETLRWATRYYFSRINREKRAEA